MIEPVNTKVILIEDETFLELGDEIQDHLELILKSVPGITLIRESGISKVIERNKKLTGSCVLAVTLDENWAEKSQELLDFVHSRSPYISKISIAFVLVMDSNGGFNEVSEWMHQLDRFYDQPFPVQIVIYRGLDPYQDTFSISGAVLSLIREMDSLEEIDALAKRVGETEEALKELIKAIGQEN